MTLVAFLRGVNVGGHRRFRPSELVAKLKKYDVTSVGAAGTFVVRKATSRTAFLADMRRALPFETEMMLCDARDLVRLVEENPFGGKAPRPNEVRFAGIFAKKIADPLRFPVSFPPEGEWFVRLIGRQGQFAFGIYRRHMKTIGYLGRMDKFLGTRVTVRNWNTIATVAKLVEVTPKRPASL